MANRSRVLPIVLLLAGCGKEFPEAWQDLGLPTEHLISAATQEFGRTKGNELVAIYSAEVGGLAELVASWDTAMTSHGHAQLCAVDHADGSITRGYGSAPQRYRLAASSVGQSGHELHLLKVPENVPDAEVCPPD